MEFIEKKTILGENFILFYVFFFSVLGFELQTLQALARQMLPQLSHAYSPFLF
jgi:hypothetical protein